MSSKRHPSKTDILKCNWNSFCTHTHTHTHTHLTLFIRSDSSLHVEPSCHHTQVEIWNEFSCSRPLAHPGAFFKSAKVKLLKGVTKRGDKGPDKPRLSLRLAVYSCVLMNFSRLDSQTNCSTLINSSSSAAEHRWVSSLKPGPSTLPAF